jgi:hypothetical protein
MIGRKARFTVVAAALAAAWLAGVSPAFADDNDDAREACRDLARKSD